MIFLVSKQRKQLFCDYLVSSINGLRIVCFSRTAFLVASFLGAGNSRITFDNTSPFFLFFCNFFVIFLNYIYLYIVFSHNHSKLLFITIIFHVGLCTVMLD